MVELGMNKAWNLLNNWLKQKINSTHLLFYIYVLFYLKTKVVGFILLQTVRLNGDEACANNTIL